MKFEFSFQKLLDHKASLEDIARRDWLQARSSVEAANRELEAMYGQIDAARVRASSLEITGGTQAASLSQIDHFISGQKILIERHRAHIRELVADEERKQVLVVEAARERKTLEKLKERRLEEYRLRRKKLELKQVDELVVTRFKSAVED